MVISKNMIDARFIKFLLVGGLNTVFGYSVFVSLVWTGLHYSLAIAVATVIGVLFNFKSTGILVFGSNNNSLVLKFVLVYIIVYIMNVLGITMLLSLGMPEWLGGMILAIPIALFSYYLLSRYVYTQ